MLDDLFEADNAAAARDLIRRPLPPPPKQAKFSAWSAIPRGVAVAAGEVGASLSDLAGAAIAFRDTPSKQMERGGLPTAAFSSDLGDSVRDYWSALKPDPQTASTAEQVLFGFSRGLAKLLPATIAAGPAGAIAAGVEEAMTVSDELRRQGVQDGPRQLAGIIQGTGMASAALPLLGRTLAETAALYVAGGPGGFMAQQALTRKVLENAGQDKIAGNYDPFDPIGLTIASVIPLAFTAAGLRAQKLRAEAKAQADFIAGPRPSEPTPVAAAVADAFRAPELSPEVVDAAMVNNLRTFGADRVMPAWHAADTFAARLDEAIAERGISVRSGDRSQAGGVAGARSISIADMPEADFMALHGNSVIDVKAHEFAHTFWAGATALPNFKDPANKPLLAEMRQMSKEFRPFVWENHKAHANKPGELMADAMAFWLKHPDRRQDFPLVDKMMRDYDAGDLQRRFPDAQINPIAEAAPKSSTPSVVPKAPAATDPIAKLNEPADAPPKPLATPIHDTVAARAADLEATMPDLVVRVDPDGRHVTLAEDLAEVRRLAAEGTDESLGALDADLLQVAVTCALSSGG